MIEIQGDFWKYESSLTTKILVCTVNKMLKKDGTLVMGAGIAKQFNDRYKNLNKIWGYQTKMQQPLLYQYMWPQWLIGLPTKNNWKDKSDINLITNSLYELKYFVDYISVKGNILMTRPGCGLGGFSWEEQVKPIMESIGFDDRYLVIHE